MRESTRTWTAVPSWVSTDGPAGDVSISTRARLARNVQGILFPTRAREADLKRVSDLVLDVVQGARSRFGNLRVIRPSHLSAFERVELVDSRLASKQHMTGGRYRPIVLNDGGTLSLMVNEEDHLRIQCILPGLQPMSALQQAEEFDRYLGSRIEYSKADNYGYLTSSLSNMGTGFRLSVMLHLGALAFLEEALQVLAAAVMLRVSVRGLLGEGTRGLGDVFQVSNETTVGLTEKEIVHRVRAAAEHLVSREQEARRKLEAEKREELAEAVERAREKLMQARSLTGREAMAHLSILRLGGLIGLHPEISSRVFRELLVSMRLGISSRATGDAEGDAKRARLVRDRLLVANGLMDQS